MSTTTNPKRPSRPSHRFKDSGAEVTGIPTHRLPWEATAYDLQLHEADVPGIKTDNTVHT